jgi:hypothetical protein
MIGPVVTIAPFGYWTLGFHGPQKTADSEGGTESETDTTNARPVVIVLLACVKAEAVAMNP